MRIAILAVLTGWLCASPVDAQDNQRSTPQASPRVRDAEMNTLADIQAKLRTCQSLPPLHEAWPGMRITLRFSFDRAGRLIGEPMVAHVSQGVPTLMRDRYLRSIGLGLGRCLPLRLSPGLGGAIAGRPFIMHYFDNRGLLSI